MSMAIEVREAHWPADYPRLKAVREAVFVIEQLVPLEMEWDGLDENALHVLALDPQGNPIGCGRLLPGGQIGRMAVLAPWRQNGIGSRILKKLLQLAAKQGIAPLFLHAQCSAIPFYRRHGFVAVGEVFMDAGIPHQEMRPVSKPV